MKTSLDTLVAPAVPVVSADFAARHARIDGDAEQDLFALYLSAATELVEKYLNRSLINRTLRWTLSDAPQGRIVVVSPTPMGWMPHNARDGVVELPYGKVQSVTEVSVAEWGEAPTVLTPGEDYKVDLSLQPARLKLDPGYTWGSYSSLSVTYVAGYGPASTDIPRPIINAVMMTALALHEHRGDTDGNALSKTVQYLLNPYRIAHNA